MADPVFISFTIQDSDGDTNTVLVPLPAATPYADVQAYATAYSLLLDFVIDGQITHGSVVFPATLNAGVKSAPVANCEVQKGALFAFDAANTSYRHSIRVPSFKPDLFSGKNVNTADADVTALVNALVDGLTVNGNLRQPTDRYGNDLSALISAVKSFRKK